MNENPAGILVIRDELTGWLSQSDRAGRECERAFCLQAWNGDTGHTIDRIGRGTIHVPAGVVKKPDIPEDVLNYFRKTGSVGGKARAKTYTKEQLSKMGRKGGRPKGSGKKQTKKGAE